MKAEHSSTETNSTIIVQCAISLYCIFIFLFSAYFDTISTTISLIALPIFLATLLLIFVIFSVNFSQLYSIYILLICLYPIVCYPFFWKSFENFIIYIGTLFTFLILSIERHFRKDFFTRGLKFVTIIIFILASYEFTTQSYIFVLDKGDIILDERLFGGASKIFRAKATFFGPLTLGNFCIFSAIILRKYKLYIIILFIIALMTQSRTAIFILAAIVMFSFITKMRMKDLFKYALLPGLMFYLIFPIDIFSMERIIQGFDTSDSTNISRLFFWISSLNFYLSYDIIHLIFGNSGAWLEFSGYPRNESAFLYTLLEGGLALLLLIYLPLAIASFRVNFFFYGAVLFTCSNINMFFYGRESSVLFSYAIFSVLLPVMPQSSTKPAASTQRVARKGQLRYASHE